MAMMDQIMKGNLVQMPAFGKLNVLKDAVLGIKGGRIVVVEENEPGRSGLDSRCKAALSKAGINPQATTVTSLRVSCLLDSPTENGQRQHIMYLA